jgi:hypothetical protein
VITHDNIVWAPTTADFVHKLEVDINFMDILVPVFVVNLEGDPTNDTDGLSSGSFAIELDVTDVAGNSLQAAKVITGFEVDNTADAGADLDLTVSADIEAGISVDESFEVEVSL